jgi:hypothetical protein
VYYIDSEKEVVVSGDLKKDKLFGANCHFCVFTMALEQAASSPAIT